MTASFHGTGKGDGSFAVPRCYYAFFVIYHTLFFSSFNDQLCTIKQVVPTRNNAVSVEGGAFLEQAIFEEECAVRPCSKRSRAASERTSLNDDTVRLLYHDVVVPHMATVKDKTVGDAPADDAIARIVVAMIDRAADQHTMTIIAAQHVVFLAAFKVYAHRVVGEGAIHKHVIAGHVIQTRIVVIAKHIGEPPKFAVVLQQDACIAIMNLAVGGGNGICYPIARALAVNARKGKALDVDVVDFRIELGG